LGRWGRRGGEKRLRERKVPHDEAMRGNHRSEGEGKRGTGSADCSPSYFDVSLRSRQRGKKKHLKRREEMEKKKRVENRHYSLLLLRLPVLLNTRRKGGEKGLGRERGGGPLPPFDS